MINPNDHEACSAKKLSSLTSSVIYFMGNCAQFDSREKSHIVKEINVDYFVFLRLVYYQR